MLTRDPKRNIVQKTQIHQIQKVTQIAEKSSEKCVTLRNNNETDGEKMWTSKLFY